VEDEEKEGGSTVKRRRERDRLSEEARNSVPENGLGKVMHLVKAFERLLTIPKTSMEKDHTEDQDLGEKGDKKRLMKWALRGLQFEQHCNLNNNKRHFKLLLLPVLDLGIVQMQGLTLGSILLDQAKNC